MIRSILIWYIVMQSFSFVGLPLAFRWFDKLPSRGYAATKAAGLLLSGIVFWWGGIIHLWNNDTAAVLTAMGIVLATGIWSMRGHWSMIPVWWREHRNFVIVTELLFLGMFVMWAFVRASQPELQTAGGEKWMEIAFLNAVLRSPQMPPHDPWLSGYAISYYYLGYIFLAMLTRLSGIGATSAFNLAAAGWFAMTACVSYNVIYDLLQKRDVLRPLLAPLMLLLTGNGEGFLEVLHAQGKLPPTFWTWMGIGKISMPPQPPFSSIPKRFFWWWQASRTLRDCAPWNLPWETCTGPNQLLEMIDEFPAFSFILGDLHSHVLNLPFVLLTVLLALQLLRSDVYKNVPEEQNVNTGSMHFRNRVQSLVSRFEPLTGIALVLGALGFINTWDFPIYWALVVGAMILSRYSGRESSFRSLWASVWSLLPEAFVLGVLSVLLYFPFWLGLRSQAGGVLPNLFHATRLRQFSVMFLPLIIPVAGLVVGAVRTVKVKWRHIILLGVGLVAGIALVGLLIGFSTLYPYLVMVVRGETVQGYSITPDQIIMAVKDRVLTPWTGLLLAIGVAGALLVWVKNSSSASHLDSRGDTLWGFPLLLTFVGLCLTLAPEFIYLKDVFFARMNTIFKFYFQAWILWSLAGAWQLANWMKPPSDTKAWRRILPVSLSGLLIVAGLVYTVLAVPARSAEQGTPWTLDGAAWVAERYPGDYQAIEWLNENVKSPSVIVEAPGDKHRAYVYEGRFSALTGLPTLLGWGGHQLQWRGNYDIPAQREADIQTLFTTTDIILAGEIAKQYGVVYIIVGSLEHQRYPTEGLAKFEAMFPVVYDRDGVQIYFASQ
ncbi:MAG: DUF2298 domain-containing protein [Anaerolineae bacterium]|nr:DUF2298 domain-containing protein [Anaerolineae bacterium]